MIPETAPERSTTPPGQSRPIRPGDVVSGDPAQSASTQTGPTLEPAARYLAEMLCEGFVCHDRRDRAGAVEAFFEVDRYQFAHLDDETAWEAAAAFVASLWAKDDVERAHVMTAAPGDRTEAFDDEGLAAADWSSVTDHLARRAEIVGMDHEYANATMEAWRRHKAGGDYWTPTLVAQAHEVRAAIGEESYAEKPRHGQSGYGHLPARYLVGLELHDMRTADHWEQAVDAMTPYFDEILSAHGGDA